jgi:hypothetical protein
VPEDVRRKTKLAMETNHDSIPKAAAERIGKRWATRDE